MAKEWRSYPKPVRTCKGCDAMPFKNGWCINCLNKNKNKKKSEYIKKQQERKKGVKEQDEAFYTEIYWLAVKSDSWCCSECSQKLPICHDESNSVDTYIARWYMHHIVPKRLREDLRHEKRNILLTCKKHHEMLESAIDYPKLGVYKYCESIKKELTETT